MPQLHNWADNVSLQFCSQLDDSEASVTTSNGGEGDVDDINRIDTYDIVVHRVIDHAEIPQKTTLGCELTIPGTDYTVREESVYQHRGGSKCLIFLY